MDPPRVAVVDCGHWVNRSVDLPYYTHRQHRNGTRDHFDQVASCSFNAFCCIFLTCGRHWELVAAIALSWSLMWELSTRPPIAGLGLALPWLIVLYV